MMLWLWHEQLQMSYILNALQDAMKYILLDLLCQIITVLYMSVWLSKAPADSAYILSVEPWEGRGRIRKLFLCCSHHTVMIVLIGNKLINDFSFSNKNTPTATTWWILYDTVNMANFVISMRSNNLKMIKNAHVWHFIRETVVDLRNEKKNTSLRRSGILPPGTFWNKGFYWCIPECVGRKGGRPPPSIIH